MVVIGVVGTWSVRWARPFVALTAASTLVLLVGPSFFLHYAAFVAPRLILVIAIGGGVLITRLQRRSGRRLAALGVVLLLAAANAPAVLATRAEPQPVAELHAAMASRGGCILSDETGLLANADLLTTVLERGCPLWPDVNGWTYDRDRMVVDGVSVPRASNTRWQRSAVAYLTSGDTFVLNRPATGLSTASRRRLDQLPVIARVGRLVARSARSLSCAHELRRQARHRGLGVVDDRRDAGAPPPGPSSQPSYHHAGMVRSTTRARRVMRRCVTLSGPKKRPADWSIASPHPFRSSYFGVHRWGGEGDSARITLTSPLKQWPCYLQPQPRPRPRPRGDGEPRQLR